MQDSKISPDLEPHEKRAAAWFNVTIEGTRNLPRKSVIVSNDTNNASGDSECGKSLSWSGYISNRTSSWTIATYRWVCFAIHGNHNMSFGIRNSRISMGCVFQPTSRLALWNSVKLTVPGGDFANVLVTYILRGWTVQLDLSQILNPGQKLHSSPGSVQWYYSTSTCTPTHHS